VRHGTRGVAYRKARSEEAKLSFMGYTLMENRSALIDCVPAVKATASVLRASPFSQGSRLLSRCKGCSPTQARNRILPQRVSTLNGQRRHRTRLPPAAQDRDRDRLLGAVLGVGIRSTATMLPRLR
jgi:hypothetical protein